MYKEGVLWERLLKIVREIIQICIKKEVTKNHQDKGLDGQIGVWRDPLKIGNLIESWYLIYTVLPLLSLLSSVNTPYSLFFHYPSSNRHV